LQVNHSLLLRTFADAYPFETHFAVTAAISHKHLLTLVPKWASEPFIQKLRNQLFEVSWSGPLLGFPVGERRAFHLRGGTCNYYIGQVMLDT
jgi:hypothetical protein